MEDQIDEKEVLECSGWGQDYDIAEDEEERLLIDEDEIVEPANQQDREFEEQIYEGEESVDAEEDILDLDANEDVVEFEDPHGNGSEEVSKECVSASTEENPSTSTESPTQVTKQSNAALGKNSAGQKRSMPYPRNPHVRRNNMQNRQSNHPIPVQMAYTGIRPRQGFLKQMRPLEPLMSAPMGRRPLMGDPRFPPPSLSAPRHPMNRIELQMPNFHPRMLQNTLRLPFKDQNPFPFNHMMQNEGNPGSNRFFVNPPYPPRCSRDIRNLSAGPAPPFPDMRPPFSSPDILPKMFHGPPPQRRDIVNPNSLLTHPRFPTNMPPPPLPVHATTLAQGPNLRMKLQSPQSLMDIVLPTPFGDPPLQPHMFSDRQPRFRFNVPDHRNHRPDFAQPPPTSGPPLVGNKRPPAKEPIVPVIPVKQIRNEPRASLPIQRTFTNNNLTEAPPVVVNRVVDSAARNPIRSSQPTSPVSGKKSLLGSPPKSTAALLPTPPSTGGVPVSVATSSVSPDVSSAAAWKVDTQGDGASPEMDEYLKKMEEQRKKREEVLRIKEERRRLKLAGKSDDTTSGATISQNTNSTLPGTRTVEQGEQSRNVTDAQSFPTKVNNATHVSSFPVKRADGNFVPGNSAVALPRTNEESAILPNEPKRSTVVASGQKVSQQTANPNARYKVIIVKNKMGQILEKRRVPLGEGVNTDTLVNKELSQVTSAWSNSRVSETVEIENLNSNATEEDVRKLCQMFGPVQEVYPKLQEGKAIVRFTSVKGANNFLCNHNTPGILVRYL